MFLEHFDLSGVLTMASTVSRQSRFSETHVAISQKEILSYNVAFQIPLVEEGTFRGIYLPGISLKMVLWMMLWRSLMVMMPPWMNRCC